MIKEYFSKLFSSPKKIIKLALAVLIIGFTVWDCFIDSPPFWHFRQEDKKAIVEYQRRHYPGAKVVDRYFPFAGNPGLVGCPVSSSMIFKYDGVKFGIIAKDGKVSCDGYYLAKTVAPLDRLIKDDFMEPRGIDADTDYTIFGYDGINTYTGKVCVYILIVDQGSTPQEVGCLYDFYKYWKINAAFLTEYEVKIRIIHNDKVRYTIDYDNKDYFSDEKEFYSAFEAGDFPY